MKYNSKNKREGEREHLLPLMGPPHEKSVGRSLSRCPILCLKRCSRTGPRVKHMLRGPHSITVKVSLFLLRFDLDLKMFKMKIFFLEETNFLNNFRVEFF
jgi:hypothetical protein